MSQAWFLPWRKQASPGSFGPASTAEKVTAEVDASHLTAIITGATSGIGKETARVLALRGAQVIIAARTMESGMRVKQSLTDADQIPSLKLHVMEMDLSSLESVRSFAKAFEMAHQHLNILINNAGVAFCTLLSIDGIELQFATNHLGHFLLTKLLLDKMKRTAKETGVQGRIINVSSDSHRASDGLEFDVDSVCHVSKSVRFSAYSHSKLANVLHANELSRHFQVEGCNLTANSLHPGLISTNVFRHINMFGFALSLFKPCLKSISQGASTTCYLALHPDVKDVSGKYYKDCRQSEPSPLAEDEELARKLWDTSEQLLSSRQTSSPC